jgi:hypothetical protein
VVYFVILIANLIPIIGLKSRFLGPFVLDMTLKNPIIQALVKNPLAVGGGQLFEKKD